jgi:hypothetical protein
LQDGEVTRALCPQIHKSRLPGPLRYFMLLFCLVISACPAHVKTPPLQFSRTSTAHQFPLVRVCVEGPPQQTFHLCVTLPQPNGILIGDVACCLFCCCSGERGERVHQSKLFSGNVHEAVIWSSIYTGSDSSSEPATLCHRTAPSNDKCSASSIGLCNSRRCGNVCAADRCQLIIVVVARVVVF